MAPRAVILLPALLAVAAAQAMNGYVPGCASTCLSDTISASTTCGAADNACICQMTYTVKRNSEFCLRSACDTAEYGQVMTGIDTFCREMGTGQPSSIATTATTEVSEPTEYPTQEPPVETPSTTTLEATPSSPAEEPPISPTEEPTGVISLPTVIEPIPSTVTTDAPTVTEVPPVTISSSTQDSVGTTSMQTTTTTAESSPTSSTTPTESPIAAGVREGAGYAAVAGGLLVAAVFGF